MEDWRGNGADGVQLPGLRQCTEPSISHLGTSMFISETIADIGHTLVIQDSALLEHKIRDENNRTRALHMLLFEASAVGMSSYLHP